MNMKVEDFNVGEKCLIQLKRVGFTTVEEIVEFLHEQAKGMAMIQAGWLKCFDEIISQLKILNFWSEELEQVWPSE